MEPLVNVPLPGGCIARGDPVRGRVSSDLSPEAPRTYALLLSVFASWPTVSAFQESQITCAIHFGHVTPHMNSRSPPPAPFYPQRADMLMKIQFHLSVSVERPGPCRFISCSTVSRLERRAPDTEMLTFNGSEN